MHRLRQLLTALCLPPVRFGYLQEEIPQPVVDSTERIVTFTSLLRRNTRGTAVWLGIRDGSEVVVKIAQTTLEVWVEVQALSALAGGPGIPQLESLLQVGNLTYVYLPYV